MIDYKKLIAEEQALRNDRAGFDTLFMEVADMVLPRASGFCQTNTKGDELNRKMYDDSASMALNKFASVIESVTIPREQKWHSFNTGDPVLDKSYEVKKYIDEVVEVLHGVRGEPNANFYSQLGEAFTSIGAFGTTVLFVDEVDGIRYKFIHLDSIVFSLDSKGNTSRVHRKFKLTRVQAIDQFGEKNLPDAILNSKNATEEFEFVHSVIPSDGKSNFTYDSVYIFKRTSTPVKEGGYNTMPYAIGRWQVAHNENYGRSPAIMILPTIRSINYLKREQDRAAGLMARPPFLVSSDGVYGTSNEKISLTAGALNYGLVSPEGQPLIQPMVTGQRPDVLEGMIESRRAVINDAFLVTLFQILVETPRMTATEVLIRAQEKGQLLSPNAGRLQSELLAPMIVRELDIAQRLGKLPKRPDILKGVELVPTFNSPINKMSRANESVGLQQTLAAAAPFLQSNPELLLTFNADEVLRGLAYSNDVPTKFLRSKQEVQQIAQAKQQQAMEQQQAATIAQSADATKTLAQAEALSGQ